MKSTRYTSPAYRAWYPPSLWLHGETLPPLHRGGRFGEDLAYRAAYGLILRPWLDILGLSAYKRRYPAD